MPVASFKPVNLKDKFELFADQWSPKVVAELNDYQVKLVKLQGDFIWHCHLDTDELFMVVEGNLRIDFRDRQVHLTPGEIFVVPKGVDHKPFAEDEVKLLLIEPKGVLNTGQEVSGLTAQNDVWL